MLHIFKADLPIKPSVNFKNNNYLPVILLIKLLNKKVKNPVTLQHNLTNIKTRFANAYNITKIDNLVNVWCALFKQVEIFI